MIAVEIKELSFAYPGGHQALDGLNLSIEKGECLGLVGPNGAGKSTLLLHLNGLLSGRSGEVYVLERPVNKQNLSWIRQKVGLVFQNPDDQLFCPTLFEDVAFGPLNSQVVADEIPGRVGLALEKVGLAGFENRSPQHLSVGEKRKASLATILSMDPEIIVLDEPSSNLDPRSRKELIGLLASLPQTRIVATHDLEMVLQLCHRVVLLTRGKAAAVGKPEEVLSDESLLRTHGLELPEVLRLVPAGERKDFIARLRNALHLNP
jgi:cobalt/nickel transport system ATP-binding protein